MVLIRFAQYNVYMCNSNSDTLWYILLVLPKAFTLLYGAYLAFVVRDVDENFK